MYSFPKTLPVREQVQTVAREVTGWGGKSDIRISRRGSYFYPNEGGDRGTGYGKETRSVAAMTIISRGLGGACAHSAQDVINILLTVERVALTFYYAGLTSRGVMRDRSLSGLSADPNNPGTPRSGNPHNVHYLQAALDAEVKHAAALVDGGAVSPYKHFYYPADTFRRLGTSRRCIGFLGVMEMLEAMCEGLYITAVQEFLRLGQLELAVASAEIMGVESEHRTLGRSIAKVSPPNDRALVAVPSACIGGLDPLLHPFLTGQDNRSGRAALRAVAIPNAARTAQVVGRYGTRRVRRFL